MNNKILVTGSRGFIGNNLLPVLLKRGYIVTQWDIKNGKDIFDSQLEEAIKGVDVVIHLAAQVSVSKSFDNPGETFYTNVLGTARVIEFCIKHQKKLIFPSSAAVYHRELSPYAESKAMGEDLVKQAMTAIPVTILRFFNIYGNGMNADSGSIMYRFLHDQKIVVYGDGEQTRDYINITDIVNILVNSIDKKWDGKVVDCGTGQAYTANYVAGLFAYYRKRKINYEPPKREIKWSIANPLLLKSLYKRPLTTNLKLDIKHIWEKYRS